MREGITRGLAKGGEIVVGEAKANCPVDTGNLRASITSEASGNECAVGTNVEYAPYQEFGTYKMAAQPFLVPALLNKKDEVVDVVREEVRKVNG